MYKPGYYLFEGNLLEYYGDDEVFDIDSGEIYPVYILDISEYKGGLVYRGFVLMRIKDLAVGDNTTLDLLVLSSSIRLTTSK